MAARLTDVAKKAWFSLEWFSEQLGWITGALTAVMMLAVLREVVGRYLFNSPTDWSVELTCYLVVVSGYLSGAYTELKEKHIRIEFLHGHLKGKARHVVDMFTFTLGMIWCGILMWQGFIMAFESYITDARSETITEWPLYHSQVMVPIGAFLLFLVLVGKMVKSISLLSGKEA